MTIAPQQPVNARTPSAQSIWSLSRRGIEIGASRSITLEQHASLPVIEIDVKREDLPNEHGFRTIVEHSRSHILWRVTVDDLHIKKTLEATDWQLFISLVEGFGASHRVTLNLDRSVHYSSEVLDSIEAFRDTASIPLWLDSEHVSWKSERVQSILKSLRLPHVYLDGPHLPAIVKDVSYYAGKHAILRCIGRNRALWFEHTNERRFAYSYSSTELQEIAARILKLRHEYESVSVVFCNRPAASTLQNVQSLSSLLSH